MSKASLLPAILSGADGTLADGVRVIQNPDGSISMETDNRAAFLHVARELGAWLRTMKGRPVVNLDGASMIGKSTFAKELIRGFLGHDGAAQDMDTRAAVHTETHAGRNVVALDWRAMGYCGLVELEAFQQAGLLAITEHGTSAFRTLTECGQEFLELRAVHEADLRAGQRGPLIGNHYHLRALVLLDFFRDIFSAPHLCLDLRKADIEQPERRRITLRLGEYGP